MQLFTAHILIFLQISIACLSFSLSGFLLKYFLFNKKDIENFEENGLFGFILVGFISLALNFFFPLSLIINNIVLLLIIFLGYRFDFFNQNLFLLLKKIFLVTLISYFLLIYSNINRPDGYLYHLPYSQILNDHKIILGLSNLHFRFGHISIFQYISSFFVNNIYSINGILIPISLVPAFFYIYCTKKFINNFDNINTRLNSYFTFLFFVISIYAFSRYSGWGNDAQVHIFYFLSIIYVLDLINNKNNYDLFFKLTCVSLFTFLIKPFYLISFLLPFIFFVLANNKINLIKSKATVFLIIFFIMWIVKNILISSCVIYPLSITCSDKLPWFNYNIANQSLSGEAWSKDWVNRENKSLDFENFNKDFNWVKTWKKNHLLIIIEKITPVLVFLFLNFLLFFFSKCLKKSYSTDKNYFFIIFLIFNFLTVLIWFLKFPLYRYGLSYIYTFIIFLFYYICIKHIDLDKIIKFKLLFIIIIYLSYSGLFLKNIIRINNAPKISIYPVMIDKKHIKQVSKIYDINGNFSHYKSLDGTECGYSKSPCTHFDVDVAKDIFYGYKIFTIVD